MESHTEKHRQTASALLCYRLGQRSTRRMSRGQRSGSVAGSWQADPRETLRGDRSVGAAVGEMKGGPEGSDCAVVGSLVCRIGRSASAVHVPPKSTGHWDSICGGEVNRKRREVRGGTTDGNFPDSPVRVHVNKVKLHNTFLFFFFDCISTRVHPSISQPHRVIKVCCLCELASCKGRDGSLPEDQLIFTL